MLLQTSYSLIEGSGKCSTELEEKKRKKIPSLPAAGSLYPSSSGALPESWEFEGPAQHLSCS